MDERNEIDVSFSLTDVSLKCHSGSTTSPVDWGRQNTPERILLVVHQFTTVTTLRLRDVTENLFDVLPASLIGGLTAFITHDLHTHTPQGIYPWGACQTLAITSW